MSEEAASAPRPPRRRLSKWQQYARCYVPLAVMLCAAAVCICAIFFTASRIAALANSQPQGESSGYTTDASQTE
ncbi:MAG: hypothetical protein LUH51_08215 [Firmicutes bacterium]|nr:hypothetical protein [Bacillota bacterium]